MAVAKSATCSMIMMTILLLFIASSIEARPIFDEGEETKHEGKAVTNKGTLEGIEAAATSEETLSNLDGGESMMKAAAATFVDGESVSRVQRIPQDDGGFVAFNADYHHPRHHPPKNN